MTLTYGIAGYKRLRLGDRMWCGDLFYLDRIRTVSMFEHDTVVKYSTRPVFRRL